MNVRPLSTLDNIPSPTKKAQRLPASKLEELRGFEFLEEVTRLSEPQIEALDATRVTFILNQLESLIKNPQMSLPAVKTACRVIAASNTVCLKEKKSLCKVMAIDADATRAASLKAFIDHLFLSGNPLFKQFSSIPFLHSYAQMYQAIVSNNEAVVEQLLSEPIDFRVKQDSYYVLFDTACLNQSYEILSLFLLKNPYITSNAYIHIILNRKLTSSQKLSLFYELSQKQINPDLPDDTGWTPLVYVIVHNDVRLLKFLIGKVNLQRIISGSSYIERAIKAKFTEGALLLARLCSPTGDLLKLAIDEGEIRVAVEIAKLLQYKWENVPEFLVQVDEVEPSLREKAIKAFKGTLVEIYKETCLDPNVSAMETLTAIRNQNPFHYLTFIKTVSHAWGIKIDSIHPETGKVLDSGGNSPFKSLAIWLSFLNKMKETVPEAHFLLNHFSRVFHYKMEPDEIEKADAMLDKGDTVVCLTGYNTHTAYALFKYDYSLYANRGADREKSGVSVYAIPFTEDIITSVKNLVFDKKLDREQYYREADMLIDLDLEYICTLDLQNQKHPHCTLNSLKAASLGSMVLELMKDGHDDDADWLSALEKVKPTYKVLTTEYRVSVLNGVLNEIEEILKVGALKSNYASLYYQILLALLVKIESTTRFDAAHKKMYGNQIKAYLNRLVDHL